MKYASKHASLLIASVTLAGSLLASTTSFAWCRDWQDNWGYWHHDCHPDHTTVVAACAPEVLDSNLQTADKVLAELSNNEFKNADTFKTKVAAIAALPDSDKTNAYFKLAGLKDPTDSDEVMNFIYAREVDQKYVTAAAQNLQLTPAQSMLLLDRLTTALKPRQ
jgi:hypothetical protein